MPEICARPTVRSDSCSHEQLNWDHSCAQACKIKVDPSRFVGIIVRHGILGAGTRFSELLALMGEKTSMASLSEESGVLFEVPSSNGCLGSRVLG